MGKLGHDVDVANNGQEAIEQNINQHKLYDIIFMDIQMPIFETTKQIRQHGIHVPIYALTANVSDYSRQHCQNVGMNVFYQNLYERKL